MGSGTLHWTVRLEWTTRGAGYLLINHYRWLVAPLTVQGSRASDVNGSLKCNLHASFKSATAAAAEAAAIDGVETKTWHNCPEQAIRMRMLNDAGEGSASLMSIIMPSVERWTWHGWMSKELTIMTDVRVGVGIIACWLSGLTLFWLNFNISHTTRSRICAAGELSGGGGRRATPGGLWIRTQTASKREALDQRK